MVRVISSGPLFAALGMLSLAQAPTSDRPPSVQDQNQGRKFEWLRRPYQSKTVNAVDDNNTPRIQSLLRAGNLYLSLSDALALAIENNLDIQSARYSLPIANTDVLRAKGGGTLRGVGASTFEMPAGVGGPPSPLINAAATGATPSTSLPGNIYDLALLATTSTSLSLEPASLGLPLPSAAGPTIPQYDPTIVGSLGWTRSSTPEQNTVTTGGSVLHQTNFMGSLTLQQGFSTGTQYSIGYNSTSGSSTSTTNTYNPATSGSLGLTVTQPLLRGFGIAVNRRWISIAKNDQKITQLIFKQQVINLIYGVCRLYYDLAGLYEDVRVKRQTLEAAKALYENTKARVEEGALADVELTRAEAQVAAAEQDLINSQGLFDEQEMIVKRVLTRRIGSESELATAHVIPTEVLALPAADDLPPLPQLFASALAQRVDLEQARLQIVNSRIALKGSRNALLPELDLFATVQNSGLAGQQNSQQSTTTAGSPTTPGTGLTVSPDASQTGGYGTFLNQLATQRYPTYEVGIQLNLPLRNRVAQADLTRDEISLRAYQTRLLALQNQAEMEAEDAVISVRRARASYDAAVRTRILQEQSLDVEKARFDAGVSTASNVILYQSYLAQAQSTEVVARGNYFKARAALDRALGASLDVHHIAIDEAYKGIVTTPPGRVP